MVSLQGNLAGPPTLCRAVLCTSAVAGSWECLRRLQESQVVKNSSSSSRGYHGYTKHHLLMILSETCSSDSDRFFRNQRLDSDLDRASMYRSHGAARLKQCLATPCCLHQHGTVEGAMKGNASFRPSLQNLLKLFTEAAGRRIFWSLGCSSDTLSQYPSTTSTASTATASTLNPRFYIISPNAELLDAAAKANALTTLCQL